MRIILKSLPKKNNKTAFRVPNEHFRYKSLLVITSALCKFAINGSAKFQVSARQT